MATEFSYHLIPLPSAKEHFRLITLLPPDPAAPGQNKQAPFDAPLRCRMTIAHLQSPGPFQALSYVWGSSKVKRRALRIQTDSCPDSDLLEITPSLETALRYLRRDSEAVTLWVDQICIDQSGNIPEKNAQVSVMGDIYRGASEVLIWLGESGEGSDDLIGKMKIGASLGREAGIEKHFLTSAPKNEEFWRMMSAVAGNYTAGQDTDQEAILTLIRRATEDLVPNKTARLEIARQLRAWFDRPWFTRIWVLQEYILSQEAVFVCGHGTIDTQEFTLGHAVVNILCTGPQATNSEDVEDGSARLELQAAVGHDPLNALAKLRRLSQNRPGAEDTRHGLCDLLREIYGTARSPMRSEQQRDRIFALLSLSRDAGDLGIVPDYSESLTVDVLYTNVARAILTSSGGDLSLLELVQFPKKIMKHDDLAAKLPSWVPDLFRPQESFSMPSRESGRGGLYAPTGALRDARVHASGNGLVISVEGILVDKIEVVGKPWLGGSPGSEAAPGVHHDHLPLTCLEYLSEVEALCDLSNAKSLDVNGCRSRDPVYLDGEERRREAPWRIMLGDATLGTDYKLQRATEEALQNLKKYLEAAGVMEEIKSLVAGSADGTLHVGEEGSESRAKFEARCKELAGRLQELLTMEVGAMGTRLDHMRNKSPFLTQTAGYVGVGPLQAQVGDIVVVFFGARVPYVLRPCGDLDERRFELVGEAYCDGIMDGELVGRPVECFYLV